MSKPIEESNFAEQTLSRFGSQGRENETINMSASYSMDRSRSQDIKNMSMSIMKSMSGSGLNDSRLSRIRSSMKKQELKGFDLTESFSAKSNQDLDSTIRSTASASGMTIIDSHTYLINRT